MSKTKFVLDRKDPALLAYFQMIAQDKRLSKNRMKEYLAKRYKDFLADRILKCIMNFFNNGFIVNLDFGNFCDAIENFIN